jgi:hypothetical protein
VPTAKGFNRRFGNIESSERQEGEGSKPYKAFLQYRDQGEGRSYARVGQELGKSKTLIERWGKQWDWQHRVYAWERDQELERQRQNRKAIIEMNGRQARIAEVCQEKVMAKLSAMTEQDVANLSVTEMARLLAVSVAVERSSRGLTADAKIRPMEEAELPPPDTNEVSEIVRKLSAIDRSPLRDISLKYLKVLHLEAKIEVEKRQTTKAAPLPENDFNNRDNLDCGFDNELPSIIPTIPSGLSRRVR